MKTSVTTAWIRNNMLFSDDQRNRKSTDAELKVPRSLCKISIPDWCLKKRSSSPKKLNVMQTERCPLLCKNPTSRRGCTSNSTTFDATVAIDDTLPYVKENINEEVEEMAPPIISLKNKMYCQKVLPETKRTKSSMKSSSPKEEIIEVNIPITKLPKKISKTYPKMSPSRKIQNINIVFPPGPKIEFPEDSEDVFADDYNDDKKEEKFILKERTFNVARAAKIEDLRNIDARIDKRGNEQKNNGFQASEDKTNPSNALYIKPTFKLRTNSTPKFSQASKNRVIPLNTPYLKLNFKLCADSTPKFSRASEDLFDGSDLKPLFNKHRTNFTPEFSQISEIATNPFITPDLKPNFLKYRADTRASEIATNPFNAPDLKPNFPTYRADTTPKYSQASEILTNPFDVSDVQPNIFELRATSTPKSSVTRSSFFREGARKTLSPNILEKSLIFESKSIDLSDIPENIQRPKKMSPNLLEKTFIFEKNSTRNKFQGSNKKPIDLELPSRVKQSNHEKNIVREIVRSINEKVRKSLQPCHNKEADRKRFVRQIVDALERGNISRMKALSSRSSINDEDSFSESEAKSYVTSSSRASYTDYGLRSPTLNDEDRTLNSENFKEETLETEKKGVETDSVYWISIPRCTLPRSSSLLSMISRLSNHGHSPCISPIKSPNDVEYSLTTRWGATYKTKNALCKRLFHETVVIDSGYSD